MANKRGKKRKGKKSSKGRPKRSPVNQNIRLNDMVTLGLPTNACYFELVDPNTLLFFKKCQEYEVVSRQHAPQQQAAAPEPVEIIPPEIMKSLSSIATNIWRARNKMVDPVTDEPKDEMRRVFRHVDEIFDSVEEMGLQIVDPTGKPYDTGMAVKVITFEETPGLLREEITETIKPSIIWEGRLLQMGEVIVGSPPES